MKKLLNNLWAVIFMLSVFHFLPFAPLNAQTNFMKHTGSNPILPLGEPGEWDDTEAAYAHVLYDGSMYQMWYSGAPQENTYRIGYATSSNGINWNKYANLVFGLGAPGRFDDTDVWLPVVLFDGSLYEMWYSGNVSGGGIGYATATDPTSWTRQSVTPVLNKGVSGDWDSNYAFLPVVMRSDTLYRMWYSGQSASGIVQTGYATSPDGINWTKYEGNPVLQVGAPGEWDAGGALASSIIYENGQYQMWYNNWTINVSQIKIGYATSPDGINWEKDTLNNPILTGDPGQWDADNVGFPRVIKEGNRYRMWYTGRATGGIDRLGYAEDTNAVAGIDTFDDVQPEHFHLKQNYPNPFNPATTIEFSLSQNAFVTLKVYNLLGEEVATLLEVHKPAGSYAVNFDASRLTSGIYYYTLTADGFQQTRKMVLLR